MLPGIQESTPGLSSPAPQRKLWIYTNFDCNLRCSYCCAASSPRAARRALELETVGKLVDEALALGFDALFFTGGEPFLLEGIYDMLAYSSQRVQTTVLTNAMLLRGKRLDKLGAIQNERLHLQVSLDGGCPEHHDPYRGAGSWVRTVEGIRNLQGRGHRVRLATTQTPANYAHLSELCQFHRELDIPEEDHFVRPMAKRGFSSTGLEVGKSTLAPEVTITLDGVYWHPLSTDPDMRVSARVFPLSEALCRVQAELEASQSTLKPFT